MSATPSRVSIAAARDKMAHTNGTMPGGPAHDDNHRVMSVSPIDAAERTDSFRGSGSISRDIMITPRVLDQNAFNALANELRQLIDGAHEASSSLQSALETAQADQAQASSASENLQERLRLSARMLKAFQLQIGRIESALDGFDSYEQRCNQAIEQLNERADAVEQRLQSNIQLYEQRIERRIEKAVEEFQHRVSCNVEDISRIETQLQQVEERSETLQAMLETAESNVSVLTYKSAQSAERAQTIAEQTQQIITQCEQVRRELGEDLVDASARIDEIDERAQALNASLSNRIEACRQAERAFDESCQRMEQTAAQSTGEADRARDRLKTLLERLEPWRAALCDQRVHDLPERLGEAVRDIRRDFGSDVAQICAALHEMAGRLERVKALSGECERADVADTEPGEVIVRMKSAHEITRTPNDSASPGR